MTSLPPSKRQKLDKTTHQDVKANDDEPLYPFRLVPSPQEARALETMEVWVTTTFAADGVQKLLRFVEERLTSLEIERQINLTHLKRVRRNGKKTDEGVNLIDIVLCAASTMSETELQAIVKDAENCGIEITPRIERVSRWPAYTFRQLSEFSTLWPVSLRKDSTRVIKDPAKQAAEMRKFMLQTISLLKDDGTYNPDDLSIAALIVDPKTSKMLLTARDTRISTRHPLNHSIMVLLNKLPSLLPADPVHEDASGDEEQYYASMYDVYVTHEPCTMCCMALVHSRIKRLIFWKAMPTGAKTLGWMKGDDEDMTLNHRYMCFEGIEGALGGDICVEDLGKDICV